MRTDTLFDDGSTDVTSRAFIIAPGSVGILSAWGFKATKEVLGPNEPRSAQQLAIVQKLAFPYGAFPDGNACKQSDSPLIVTPDYTYAEDVTQCGLWTLSSCQNLVAMAVPGTYRLQLNDAGALGTVFISLTRYSQSEVGYVPRGIFLGETNG